MNATPDWISDAASRLEVAEREVHPLEPLTDECPELSIEDAYGIQMTNVRRRLCLGARVVGHKIGLTSKAMQVQLGVDRPDYGHLFDAMFVPEEQEIPRSQLLVPRVEPEVAFVLARDLAGPGVTTADVLTATGYVVPALEIIDSRIVGWRIRIQDTIADNASSARVVLGSQAHHVRDLDLPHVPVVLRRNGVVVDTATGAAVLGNPVSAVVWLANALASFDVGLRAGQVVLSGSFSAAVSVDAGDAVSASFGSFGAVTTRFSA